LKGAAKVNNFALIRLGQALSGNAEASANP